MIIPLNSVKFDIRARNGTWCTLSYPNHKKGCPNFPKCVKERSSFLDYELDRYEWYAVVKEFDLLAHAKRMKEKHPHWTERQCRNLLYWQNSIRSKLRKETEKFADNPDDIILDIPEANGIDIFKTMANHGIKLQRNPDLVRKIMLVGKRNERL